jgi:hypothetical protein
MVLDAWGGKALSPLSREHDPGYMSAKFLYPSGTDPKTARPEVLHSEGGPQPPGAHAIDWHSARLAARACCCSAKPAVIAVMPASASRPHPTDLLLCAHHYRASRHALDLAGARVLDLDGRPVTGDLWPARAGARRTKGPGRSGAGRAGQASR